LEPQGLDSGPLPFLPSPSPPLPSESEFPPLSAFPSGLPCFRQIQANSLSACHATWGDWPDRAIMSCRAWPWSSSQIGFDHGTSSQIGFDHWSNRVLPVTLPCLAMEVVGGSLAGGRLGPDRSISAAALHVGDGEGRGTAAAAKVSTPKFVLSQLTCMNLKRFEGGTHGKPAAV
jgi:hypothetical protein